MSKGREHSKHHGAYNPFFNPELPALPALPPTCYAHVETIKSGQSGPPIAPCLVCGKGWMAHETKPKYTSNWR